MKKVGTAVLILLTVGALYLCAAFFASAKMEQTLASPKKCEKVDCLFEYDGIQFRDEHCLRVYLRQEPISKCFPWLSVVPSEITPAAAAACFGLLGGLVMAWKKLAVNHVKPAPMPVFSQAVLGFLMGVVVWFVSFVVPSVIPSAEFVRNPECTAGAALVGGLFAELVLNRIRNTLRISQPVREAP